MKRAVFISCPHLTRSVKTNHPQEIPEGDFAKTDETVLATTKKFDDADQNDRTDQRNDEAIKIEARYTGLTDEGHNPTSKQCTDDTDYDVHQATLLRVRLHNHGGDPTDQCSKNNPENDTHRDGIQS